ncbi:SRPBCC family protein [bacterium]|nr:SRPBCC family protein [bacterium]
MSATRKTHTAVIDADVEACIAVLADFENHPRWSTPVLRAAILSCDEEGRGRNVAFQLDMKIRRISYVLEHTYDLPHRISWNLVEGDVAGVKGSYEFEPIGPGRTRATCTQIVDIGFWIPGPLRRLFEEQALADAVGEFKHEVERRAAERRSAGDPPPRV